MNRQWTAVAHPNIALVKYWGKRDEALNLPAVGSISITLDTLESRTTLEEHPGATADTFYLNDRPAPENQRQRVQQLLNLFREATGEERYFVVRSTNNFPTGAGLASSASGFAALAVAANAAFEHPFDERELSAIARRGSGSAARSIFGGWVEMHRGERPDGSDAVAEPLLAPEEWPLTVFVCITSGAPKAIGSTEGMTLTARTSPFYPAWVEHQEADLAAMRAAIARRDFEQVIAVAEHSCLKMHGLMLSAQPGLVYWNSVTVAIIHAVRRMREEAGIPVFFTIDAGPQVKVICPPEVAEPVRQHLQTVEGIQRIFTTGLGEGAHLVNTTTG